MNSGKNLFDMQDYWRIRNIVLALFLALGAMTVQMSPDLLRYLVEVPLPVKVADKKVWAASLVDLPSGHYYLSVGKTRTGCDLKIDGSLLASTRSGVPELRTGLALGAGLKKVPGMKAITVRCEDSGGFEPRFAHRPTLGKYWQGLLLDIWRSFIDIYLATLGSLVLIITSMVTVSKTRKGGLKNSQQKFLMFGFVGLIYSLSLSNYPMYFLKGLDAAFLHMIIRVLFSFSLIFVVSKSNSRLNGILYLVHLVMLSAITVFYFRFPGDLVHFYSRCHIIFGLMTLAVGISFLKIGDESEYKDKMSQLVFACAFLQLIDSVALSEVAAIFNISFTSYLSVIISPMLAIFLARARFRQAVRSHRIEEATFNILNAMGKKMEATQLLMDLADIVGKEISFSDTSTFVDQFYFGSAKATREKLVRVPLGVSPGYFMETLDLSSPEGAFLKESMEKGLPALEQKEDVWGLIVPIGNSAIIHFKDDQISRYTALDALDLVTRLSPAMKRLEEKFISDALNISTGLGRIRLLRGTGRWTTEVGVCFLDICDYSVNTEKFGTTYTDFVASEYFPSLLKFIHPFACFVESRGDELFLLSLSDLIPKDLSPVQSMALALNKILQFIKTEGFQLCLDRGIPPVEVTIGVSSGVISVTCDETGTHCTGRVLNEAKRFQEAAPPGGPLVDAHVAGIFEKEGFSFGEEFPILVKKNLLGARAVNGWNVSDL